MDRRSWLWRRKSSEKSPAETESLGSISSHSERFSDEQAYPNHSTQSPEVTSKVPLGDDETDNVKSLKEKLSAALLNIIAKEELVKEHEKVTEEAVSGWEKAENEVLSLKQELEVATQKNLTLEDRINHLDGALKECVRQLRQAREQHEQKTHDVISKKTREWELTKSKLEVKLGELQAQQQSSDPNLRLKFEAVQKENASLKLDLLSRAEEVEIRIIERDLSSQAAEVASKQHLESIKKVAKLEAECRKFKAIIDNKKFLSASYVNMESGTDSQSDSLEGLTMEEPDAYKINEVDLNVGDSNRFNMSGPDIVTEVNRYKNKKSPFRNFMAPSLNDINLMDDFLEMEKLAALPVKQNVVDVYQLNGEESELKVLHDTMIKRTVELEKKLEKMESEKTEMERVLTECAKQLALSQSQLNESKKKLVELQLALTRANELKDAATEEVQTITTMREVAESHARSVEGEIKMLLLKVGSLEEKMELERVLSDEHVAKCRKLEVELLRMGQKERALSDENVVKFSKLEDELRRMKKNEQSLSGEYVAKCSKLEDELQRMKKNEQALSDEYVAKCRKLEDELLRMRHLSDENVAKCGKLEDELQRMKKKEQDLSDEHGAMCRKLEDELLRTRQNELALSNENVAKCRILEEELLRMKIKEQVLSDEYTAKCRKLEDELLRMKQDAGAHRAVSLNGRLKMKQDQELAVATSKFAECQKTIASLGQQLKSLATLEDLLIDL